MGSIMFNPFDLRGPEFLLFYSMFGAAVDLGLFWFYRNSESRDISPGSHIEDPYEIAFLRGGAEEAIKVAVISMIDRGLLAAEGKGTTLLARGSQMKSVLKRPLEQHIFSFFAAPQEVDGVFHSLGVLSSCQMYQDKLSNQGLLAGSSTYQQRTIPFLLALCALLGVAGLKIYIALARGRHNILFLIILSTMFFGIAVWLLVSRKTAAGDHLLERVRDVFGNLRARASSLVPGGATNELAFLAAVFGAAAVPVETFPFLRELRKDRAFAQAGSGGGGGCSGGGCGSSGCSGGGGGCGSGCGGGCGGCGG